MCTWDIKSIHSRELMSKLIVHTNICTRINRLTPNDSYMGRIAPLTSKRCILYIYSTNTDTE